MTERSVEEEITEMLDNVRKTFDAATEPSYPIDVASGLDPPPRRPATATTNPGSSRNKRVVVDETPRYYSIGERQHEDEVEDYEPLPIQTPYASTTKGRAPNHSSSPRTSPPQQQQQQQQPRQSPTHLQASPGWKASMNHLMDTIEDRTAHASKLEQENIRLGEKVDILVRDYARLQEDYRVQKSKLAPLLEENEELRKIVDDLRQDMVAEKERLASENAELRLSLQDARAEHNAVERLRHEMEDVKDQLTSENDEFRIQLRDARTERDAMARQNDHLHGRIRQMEQQQHKQQQAPLHHYYQERPSRTTTNNTTTTRLPSSDHRRSGYRTSTKSEERRSPGRRHYLHDNGYSPGPSPGQELVRDLSERTNLDPEYLEPLSDLLDRRLGRTTTTTAEPPQRGATTTTPSRRRNTSLYSA